MKKTISFTEAYPVSTETVDAGKIYHNLELTTHVVCFHFHEMGKTLKEKINNFVYCSFRSKWEKGSNVAEPITTLIKDKCELNDFYKNNLEPYFSTIMIWDDLTQKIKTVCKLIQNFQNLLDRPSSIHIYNQDKDNVNLIQSSKEPDPMYSYQKYLIHGNSDYSIFIFIPNNEIALTRYHSHSAMESITITYNLKESAFSITTERN
ncbi:MAG: hypothetical protein VW397_02260 [Candidatus Margulisiibacteriota bacterium]